VNSAPLTADMLRGKVVLVDFWEYTCVNWIRTSPYVKAWHRDYADRGLVVVGVHAPEFEFGKRAENIDRGIRDHGLTCRKLTRRQFPHSKDLRQGPGSPRQTGRPTVPSSGRQGAPALPHPVDIGGAPLRRVGRGWNELG